MKLFWKKPSKVVQYIGSHIDINGICRSDNGIPWKCIYSSMDGARWSGYVCREHQKLGYTVDGKSRKPKGDIYG
jgi:hypothetical protein